MTTAGTPPSAIEKLHQAVVAALETEEVRKALAAGNLTPVGGDAQALSELIRTDYERWGKVVSDQGIKLQ